MRAGTKLPRFHTGTITKIQVVYDKPIKGGGEITVLVVKMAGFNHCFFGVIFIQCNSAHSEKEPKGRFAIAEEN